jgi:hypothetical protein
MSEKLLRKLSKLESRQPEPMDPGAAMEHVRRQLDIIAIRRRAVTGWREPSAAERVATMRRVAEAAARHTAPAA